MHHGGYESEMSGRGQPPLAFYLRAISHSLALGQYHRPVQAPGARGSGGGSASAGSAGGGDSTGGRGRGGDDIDSSNELLLVSSTDWSNPVLPAIDSFARFAAELSGSSVKRAVPPLTEEGPHALFGGCLAEGLPLCEPQQA